MLLFEGGCQQLTQQPNTNYANGERNPAASIALCWAACNANGACNGFDWVPTATVGRQCWLSGYWSGARGSIAGVTHYVLNRNCAPGPDILRQTGSPTGGIGRRKFYFIFCNSHNFTCTERAEQWRCTSLQYFFLLLCVILRAKSCLVTKRILLPVNAFKDFSTL